MNRRLALQTLAAALATGALTDRAFAAQAAAAFDVERLGDGGLVLRWSGAAGPVSLFASSDPDAPAPLMRPLGEASGAALTVALATAPRPYFLLQDQAGLSLRAGERVLPLEGGVNFRDLGGYQSEDGRRVRWGRLYRSGVMAGLTLNDYDYLRGLGVEVICDLRSAEERTAEATNWSGPGAPEIVTHDYGAEDMSDAGSFSANSADEARALFASMYADMPTTLERHYADMFARLLRGQAPLAFHCSAGKDRTGMAAALILTALGVSRETVIADYALSAKYFNPSSAMRQMSEGAGEGGSASLSAEAMQAFLAMPREALAVFMGADPVVMREALATIDARDGGPLALLQTRFGIGAAECDRLRALYLA